MTQAKAAAPRGAGELAINGGTPVTGAPVAFMRVALAEEDIEAAVQTLRSGMLCQGARVADFQKRFAEATGARHALACANGTCALQLAYEPLFSPGDEVLVPAWTYVATASMVAARGGVPVFCDADPETYCINVDDASARVTDRTRAIAATHLYGNPVDIDGVQSLAGRHGLKVIYDAAQSHLATYNDRPIGAFGDAVTYSFYATKNMTTGEGGMVTVNDDALAAKIALLRSHGETQKYLHEHIGYNYRMTDVEAAIGLGQLSRLAALTQQRRDAAARLDEIVGGVGGLHPPRATPGAMHVYHLYPVRMDLASFACSRDAFVEALRAEGVPTALHYPRPLTRQPCFKRWVKGNSPVADALARSLFCLPMRPDLSEGDFDIIDAALRKVAAAYAV